MANPGSTAQKAFYIGLNIGTGTIEFEGERFDERSLTGLSFGTLSYGPYLSILGVGQIEASILTLTDEPSSTFRMSDQYPATVLRFSVGYPL